MKKDKILDVIKTKEIEQLGRKLIIPKNTEVFKNGKNFSIKYFVPTVEVLIGIGKNHTASLIMDEDA